jgi:hypothetical protein
MLMLVFSTRLCELLPLLPSLWYNSPSPSLCQSTVYTDSVWRGEGGDTLYLTRFRTYKIARPPKNLGEEGASDR